MPTRELNTQMQRWAALQKATPSASKTLSYGGGVDGIGVTSGTPKVIPRVLRQPVGQPGHRRDGYTIVEGHEYAETITDQNPAGGATSARPTGS